MEQMRYINWCFWNQVARQYQNVTLNSDWNAQKGSFLHYNTVFDQADKTGD